jgi:hypothetical protein
MKRPDCERLSRSGLAAAVQAAVKGAADTDEAEIRVRETFSPAPLVTIANYGPEAFAVLLFVHHENINIICER